VIPSSVVQANEKANRQARSANVLDIQFGEVLIKDRLVDAIRQTIEWMATVEDLIQPGAQQNALVNYSCFGLHEITGK
jgi:hypothetical protein